MRLTLAKHYERKKNKGQKRKLWWESKMQAREAKLARRVGPPMPPMSEAWRADAQRQQYAGPGGSSSSTNYLPPRPQPQAPPAQPQTPSEQLNYIPVTPPGTPPNAAFHGPPPAAPPATPPAAAISKSSKLFVVDCLSLASLFLFMKQFGLCL